MTAIALMRRWERIRARAYTALISPGLGGCGGGTTLKPPLRLDGEEGIYLGSDVFVGPGSWLQTISPKHGADNGTLSIGTRTRMAGYCVLSAAARIDVGKAVLFGRNVVVVDHNHSSANPSVPVLDQGVDALGPVRIGDGAWLAQNVVVCPGVTIGDGVVVGANSVVTSDLPAGCLAVGTPARVMRRAQAVGE